MTSTHTCTDVSLPYRRNLQLGILTSNQIPQIQYLLYESIPTTLHDAGESV